jgi:hypothetical protein
MGGRSSIFFLSHTRENKAGAQNLALLHQVEDGEVAHIGIEQSSAGLSFYSSVLSHDNVSPILFSQKIGQASLTPWRLGKVTQLL